MLKTKSPPALCSRTGTGSGRFRAPISIIYTTILGHRDDMDTQKRIRELVEERNWTDYRLAKEANPS